MGHPRDWNNALGPAISVGIFSIVSYCHQGTILHRSKWDKQTLWLPILYAMSPHIYASQLFLNALLCWNRFHTMRRIYGARQCRDGFLWYLCAILGMHTDSRAFHDPPVFIAGQGREKDQGMLRLNSCESVRLKRRKKSGHENFSRIFCTSRVLWLCLSLYHVVYGLVAYVRRVATLPNATLGIDHLAGTYAINGALVTLANLVLVIQPYEWDDSNHESEEYCEAKSDVDTSNAWVYEGFIALVLQASTWLGMKLWRFGVTVSQSIDTAARDRTRCTDTTTAEWTTLARRDWERAATLCGQCLSMWARAHDAIGHRHHLARSSSQSCHSTRHVRPYLV